MVKIEYIWHDCFFVETPAAGIVFDFWLDRDGENGVFPIFLQTLIRERLCMYL